jgi:DNA-binding XRE family transcriptional regulator
MRTKKIPLAFLSMNMPQNIFIDRLAKFRIRKGWTHHMLGFYLGGISGMTIWRWENGASLPSIRAHVNALTLSIQRGEL